MFFWKQCYYMFKQWSLAMKEKNLALLTHLLSFSILVENLHLVCYPISLSCLAILCLNGSASWIQRYCGGCFLVVCFALSSSTRVVLGT